jgi:hypothetical protein
MPMRWTDADGNLRSDPPTLADTIKLREKAEKQARDNQQGGQQGGSDRLDGDRLDQP